MTRYPLSASSDPLIDATNQANARGSDAPCIGQSHLQWPEPEHTQRVFIKLERLLDSLDAVIPKPPTRIDWATTLACRWVSGSRGWVAESVSGYLQTITPALAVSLDDILFVDRQKHTLTQNTEQFLAACPANHALLTGARGTGKSSLISALLKKFHPRGLRLIEVGRDDLAQMADIGAALATQCVQDEAALAAYSFILYCDDLSFDQGDDRYRGLKVALEGSLVKKARYLVYASSNRRHLLPDMWQDNEGYRVVDDGEIHPSESVEEKIALSDRFGLWLSFHSFGQEQYLAIVRYWITALHAELGGATKPVVWETDWPEIKTEALQFALERSTRSGRLAKQFAQMWVGVRAAK